MALDPLIEGRNLIRWQPNADVRRVYPSGEDRGSGWLDSPWPAPSPCDVLDGAVDLGGVDRMRVEAFAGPLGHLGMALVLRIGERLQELLIARRTADVLGRAAADSLKEPRIGGSRIARLDPLDLDRVLPPIAKVVKIGQRLGAFVIDHLQQRRLARVERTRPAVPFGIGKAPAHIASAELPEVAVGPAQHRLQN